MGSDNSLVDGRLAAVNKASDARLSARRRGGRSLAAAPLLELPTELLGSVFGHPANRAAVNRIAELAEWLRNCTAPDHFMELQQQLFHHLVAADHRRAEAAHMVKRLSGSRRSPASDIEPPFQGDPTDPESWVTEVVAHARIVRHLRAVGDGMAWRLLHYDRRIIGVLADSPTAGPLVKRADSSPDHERGFTAEIAAVNDLWQRDGDVAMLNSLTNCLRIGDVTVVRDGKPTLHEVKSNPRNYRSAQRSKIEKAQAAIGTRLQFPRSGMRVVDLAEEFDSDLDAIAGIVALARSRGVRGAKLSEGRAVLATSLVDLGRLTDESLPQAQARIDRERRSATRRAGIGSHDHTLRGVSGDLASRMPLLPPWVVFPLAPPDCALLTCDLLLIDTQFSLDVLSSLAAEAGLRLEHSLALQHDRLDPLQPALSLSLGARSMTVYPNSLSPLLFEFVKPSTWIRGMREVLATPFPDPQPWGRFRNDHAFWQPPLLHSI